MADGQEIFKTTTLEDEILAGYAMSTPIPKDGIPLPTLQSVTIPFTPSTTPGMSFSISNPTTPNASTPVSGPSFAEMENIVKQNMATHQQMQAYYNQMIIDHPKLLEMEGHPTWELKDKRVREIKTIATMQKHASKFQANMKLWIKQADALEDKEIKIRANRDEIEVKQAVSKDIEESRVNPAALANEMNSHMDASINQVIAREKSDDSSSDSDDEEANLALDEDEELAMGMYQLELFAAKGATAAAERFEVYMPQLVPTVKQSEAMLTGMWLKYIKKYPNHPWVIAARGNPFLLCAMAHAAILNVLLQDLTNQEALRAQRSK